MNCFETVWSLLKMPLIDGPRGQKQIDPMDFTWNELLYAPEKFPKGGLEVQQYINSPEGEGKMTDLRKVKMNYPLNQNLLREHHENRNLPNIDFSNPMGDSDRRLPVYLAETTTMPSRSTSYPTELCATGKHLKDKRDSTCYGCYAEGFTYNSNNATRNQLKAYNDMLQDPIGYHSQLASQIPSESHNGYPVFRMFDSGDLHSPEHLAMLLDMATLNPDVIHWIPTREFGMVNKVLSARGYAHDALPPNVRLRMSMPYRNQTIDDEWNRNVVGEHGVLNRGQRRVLDHPQTLRSEVWDEWLVNSGMLPDSAIVGDTHFCPKDDPNSSAKACVPNATYGPKESANCLACMDGDVPNVSYINKPKVGKIRLNRGEGA